MKQVCLAVIGILLAINSTAQVQLCGTDELSQQLFHLSDAVTQQRMMSNRAYLKNFTEQFVADEQARGGNDSLYIIPVVFHVIHTYGSENVTDAQIMSGLHVLNRNFRNLHPDTGLIPAAFKSISADCEIEFRLAHKDPNGVCSNGINRIASLRTKIGDHSVKDLIHWDPSKYLNVYVVKSIANLAGHCLMPDQADAKPEWDGIVIDDSYLGNTGTSSEQTSVVMAHEAGHYLNLFHIWGGNNVPGYFYQPVGQPGNCAIGDDVTDTPPTIGWSNCNLNAASCGNTIDNVQNAMDYSYCNFMFTQGQRQRMRAALNSPIAARNNLISAANHQQTGIDLNELCSVSFQSSAHITCVLDTVFFTDKSLATPDSWLWNFGDGETSTLQNPAHVYYSPGTYQVSLTAVKNGLSLNSATQTIYVSDQNPLSAYVQDFENILSMSDAALLSESDNPALEFDLSYPNSGYNSSLATWIHASDTTDNFSGRSTLTSSAVNLGGQVNPSFSMQYACSQRVLNSEDALEVFISNDCGHTWFSMGKRKAANLRTVSSEQSGPWWTPADSTQWKSYSFTVPQAYCVSNFMFRIEATVFRINSLYIDDINLNRDDYTALQETTLNVFDITPNPASHVVSIESDFSGSFTVSDFQSKVIYASNQNSGDTQIDISAWPPGVYVISGIYNETAFCKKLVKF